MKVKFKIFKLEYLTVETYEGFFDGSGKKYENQSVLRTADLSSYQSDVWNTEDQAELAIEKYGKNWTEYVIQKITKIMNNETPQKENPLFFGLLTGTITCAFAYTNYRIFESIHAAYFSFLLVIVMMLSFLRYFQNNNK